MGKLIQRKEVAPRIVRDPNIRAGRPVIQGTRVPVDILVGQLVAGLPPEEVADAYGVTVEDVLAAKAFADRKAQKRR
jgi:uncharacterized protein (DUF433 family)